MQERSQYLDLAKGIAIFLMVFCHTGYSSLFNVWVYAFHMPIFFFISGMFVNEKKYSVFQFINKRFKQIFIPYLIFALIYCFGQKGMLDWLNIFYGSRNALSQAKTFTPLWFLPCIFSANVLFFLILKYFNSNRARLISCVTAAIIGFLLTVINTKGYPLSLNVALVCTFLMFAGHYLHKRNCLSRKAWWGYLL